MDRTTKLERAELGLQGANFTRLLVDDLRLLGVCLRLRAVLRLRRLTECLTVDLFDRLGGKLAEQKTGNEQVGGDAPVDVGVVVEKRHNIALFFVGERPACFVAVAVYE